MAAEPVGQRRRAVRPVDPQALQSLRWEHSDLARRLQGDRRPVGAGVSYARFPNGVESHPTLSQPPTDEGWRAGAGLSGDAVAIPVGHRHSS